MSTFDRVKKIVVDQLGVSEADVTIDSTFIDDLGADSLDIVELIMAFEEEFDIEIPDDAAEKIKTVKNAVDYSDSQMKCAFAFQHHIGSRRGIPPAHHMTSFGGEYFKKANDRRGSFF